MTGVVLVTGPPSAGATSMIAVLRDRVSGWDFVERADIGSGVAPAAVLFVVSAIAPVTESDCALAELVAERTGVMLAVVSKIDDHRDWRAVLALNRERLAGYAERFGGVPWAAAAPAPRMGPPLVDELVTLLVGLLEDPEKLRRNRWCAPRYTQARVDELANRRDELWGRRVLLGAEAGGALRSRIQHARVTLTFSVRHRCVAARTELLAQIAGTRRWQVAEAEDCLRRRFCSIVADVDDEIAGCVRSLAVELGLPVPPLPPPRRPIGFVAPASGSGRLETQLMAVLGAGFGLGVALLVSRVFAGLAPQASVAGAVAGGVVGVAVTVWVVRSRGVLQHRAVLERWVNDVLGTVRATSEERVLTCLLAAEAALSPAHVARTADRRRALDRRIAAVEAELRESASVLADAEDAGEGDPNHGLTLPRPKA